MINGERIPAPSLSRKLVTPADEIKQQFYGVIVESSRTNRAYANLPA